MSRQAFLTRMKSLRYSSIRLVGVVLGFYGANSSPLRCDKGLIVPLTAGAPQTLLRHIRLIREWRECGQNAGGLQAMTKVVRHEAAEVVVRGLLRRVSEVWQRKLSPDHTGVPHVNLYKSNCDGVVEVVTLAASSAPRPVRVKTRANAPSVIARLRRRGRLYRRSGRWVLHLFAATRQQRRHACVSSNYSTWVPQQRRS